MPPSNVKYEYSSWLSLMSMIYPCGLANVLPVSSSHGDAPAMPDRVDGIPPISVEPGDSSMSRRPSDVLSISVQQTKCPSNVR